MALDSITLSLLARELDEKLQGSRVDKVHQPSKDEVVFHLRKRDGNLKLLLSARSGSARICTTEEDFENPRVPPSFCMLLRKYFRGARFVSAQSVEGERIIMLSFTATSEMGDTIDLDIAAELMGRYANLVIIGGDGKIIDAMKRVDADASRVRQLLPGLTYKLPPNTGNPKLISQGDEVLEKVFKFNGPVDKAFLKCSQGMGAVLAREIAYRSNTESSYGDHLTLEEEQTVKDAVEKVKAYYKKPEYSIIYNRQGMPAEYSFMPLLQYTGLETKDFDSINDLLNEYYSAKDKAERLRQKGKDLHKLVGNLIDRTQRKQIARKEELADSTDNEKYRIYGELLTANLHNLEKGMKTADVFNYYDGSTVTVKLDPRLTGNQNAQKYYKEYKKKQTAVKVLTDLIAKGEIELEYLKSVEYAVNSAKTEAELMLIRSELHDAGYLKYYKNREKKQKPRDFIRYESSEGFLILIGRNNVQNDKLTMKTARGKDLWFHVKNAPGSHVVVMSEGRDIPVQTQNEAAMLAAYYSSYSGQAKVEVDYTFVKNIKKTNDLKPGMVIYDTYNTAYISPDTDVIDRLKRIK